MTVLAAADSLVASDGVVTANALGPSDLEPFRRELTGYCYRMLGSGFEAEDAVQETMLRAFKGADRFEGRSSLRTWLYRIATNVCIDMSRQVQRRARPVLTGHAGQRRRHRGGLRAGLGQAVGLAHRHAGAQRA